MSEQLLAKDPSLTAPTTDPGIITMEQRLNESLRFVPDDWTTNTVREAITDINVSELDGRQKLEAVDLLVEGQLHGKEVGLKEVYRNNVAEVSDRVWMADVFKRDPQVAETLVDKGVVGFHATQSFALAGLIEDGAMLSGRKLKEAGKASITGAHDASPKGQSSTSFGILSAAEVNLRSWGGADRVRTDDQVIDELKHNIEEAQSIRSEYEPGSFLNRSMEKFAEDASKALNDFVNNPNSLAATMMRYQFPVLVGINGDFVRQAEETREKGNLNIGQSYYGEFRPNADMIPIEALPVIAVPQDKVEPVRKLLGMFNHAENSVVAIESLVPSYPNFDQKQATRQ